MASSIDEQRRAFRDYLSNLEAHTRYLSERAERFRLESTKVTLPELQILYSVAGGIYDELASAARISDIAAHQISNLFESLVGVTKDTTSYAALIKALNTDIMTLRQVTEQLAQNERSRREAGDTGMFR